MKHVKVTLIGMSLLLLSNTACNRGTLRVPGASTAFPDTTTHYLAKTKLPYRLVILVPVDDRSQHFGEKIAGTKWKACSSDALWGKDAAPQLIQQRLVQEFSSSGMFAEVTTGEARPGDVVLRTDIRAFCSRVEGFIYGHVGGITSLEITMERDGNILFDKKFEKVVTDSDPEYRGLQVGFIEQAMRVTMSDSLRVLMTDLLQECDATRASLPPRAQNPDKSPHFTFANS